MIPRSLACLLGVVGGGAWVLRLGLALVGDPDGFLGTVLEYGGLLLLLVALFAAGAGLVKQSTAWLRVVVGVAFPLLVWSVATLAYPLGEVGVQALAGAMAIVVSGWVLVAAPAPAPAAGAARPAAGDDPLRPPARLTPARRLASPQDPGRRTSQPSCAGPAPSGPGRVVPIDMAADTPWGATRSMGTIGTGAPRNG